MRKKREMVRLVDYSQPILVQFTWGKNDLGLLFTYNCYQSIHFEDNCMRITAGLPVEDKNQILLLDLLTQNQLFQL